MKIDAVYPVLRRGRVLIFALKPPVISPSFSPRAVHADGFIPDRPRAVPGFNRALAAEYGGEPHTDSPVFRFPKLTEPGGTLQCSIRIRSMPIHHARRTPKHNDLPLASVVTSSARISFSALRRNLMNRKQA